MPVLCKRSGQCRTQDGAGECLRRSSIRVLVIVTFRPEFAPPRVGRPQLTLLSLNRLPKRQRVEMITRVTGGKALPKEIADQIVDRTDGVPLFIERITNING